MLTTNRRINKKPHVSLPFRQVTNGLLQRKCACGGTPRSSGECEACLKKRLQRRANNSTAEAGNHLPIPPIVHEVLRSPGQPLDPDTRAFMEPRFGHDFSQVRVHTDERAIKSARAVNALAYTVGGNVVFAAGRYAPTTPAGRRLMAHELTHVVQQGQAASDIPMASSIQMDLPSEAYEKEADVAAQTIMDYPDQGISPVLHGRRTLQRKCGSDLGPAIPVCTHLSGDRTGEVFQFKTNCDDILHRESAHVTSFLAGLPAGTTLVVHGYATPDGPELDAFNWQLSCHRANAMAKILRAATTTFPITDIFAHGPVAGPASLRQAAWVESTSPAPTPAPKCGPDATDWFVLQVNRALTDPAVLDVKSDMTAADVIARRYGTTATQLAEGGAAAAVLAQEAKLKATGAAPPLNPTIKSQLTAGVASGAAATAALTPVGPLDPRLIDGPMISFFVGRAALRWRALVNHKARYDFKAWTDSMNHPKTSNCPQEGCDPGEVGIITLCPGTNPENCYESDLPGNLFYALIGRHVGFSELTLQLGSQFAELTDTTPRPARPAITWDSPEDTAAISLGFKLPLPLTKTAFCSKLAPARSSLDARVGCEDCLDPTPSIIH